MSDFRLDPKGIRQIMAGEDWARYVLGEATRGAVEARAAWHAAGPHPYETGDYVDSIEPDIELENGEWIGRVNAFDWKANFIEFGTSDTPTFAPLQRGADAAGLHLENVKGKGLA